MKHYSQRNHCNDNCNDFSDYNDIIAPLDKLIMSFIDKTHYHLVLRGAIMLHSPLYQQRSTLSPRKCALCMLCSDESGYNDKLKRQLQAGIQASDDGLLLPNKLE